MADEQLSKFTTKSQMPVQDSSNHLARLQKHLAFSCCQDKLALKGGSNIMSPPGVFPIGSSPNGAQVKSLLTSNQGTLYQDSSISVQYKSEFSEGQGRIAM